ncbi:F-box protein PP2-B5-like [Solanum dulcamara]|uniref:F-box protein PP2-B5-like n=1 Tax=Solanum dulcamara TaxID=45834 RepID=UPI002485C5A0|nr:F-box protein PP2-B5-like [Solanum dulcamara]
MVSPKTDYVAYLVFKLVDTSNGLESANLTIMSVSYKADTATEEQGNIVQLISKFPKLRGDGWMEIELGNLNSKEGSDGLFIERLIEIKRPDHELSGLNIEGIEFRPKIIE